MTRALRRILSKLAIDKVLTSTLNATMEALPIVNKFCSQIRGFEVIQGTMDDVFLNALSRQEVAQ